MIVRGEIVRGDGIGRRLGWPTANVAVPEADGELAGAANGVYAAVVDIDGRRWHAMANLGVKPTFGGSRRVLELHIFDFEGDLYGREVTAELTEFVRPERKFDSAEDLRSQIEKDKKHILACI